MKRYYNRWKDLVWYERIIAIPGIIVVVLLALIISPIILLLYTGALTCEIFDINEHDL